MLGRHLVLLAWELASIMSDWTPQSSTQVFISISKRLEMDLSSGSPSVQPGIVHTPNFMFSLNVLIYKLHIKQELESLQNIFCKGSSL